MIFNIEDLEKNLYFRKKQESTHSNSYQFKQTIKGLVNWDYYGSIHLKENSHNIYWSIWRETDNNFANLKVFNKIEDTPFWFQNLIQITKEYIEYSESFQANLLHNPTYQVKFERTNPCRSGEFTNRKNAVRDFENSLTNIRKRINKNSENSKYECKMIEIGLKHTKISSFRKLLEEVQKYQTFIQQLTQISNINWEKNQELSIIYSIINNLKEKELNRLKIKFKWDIDTFNIIRKYQDVNIEINSYNDNLYFEYFDKSFDCIPKYGQVITYIQELIENSHENWLNNEESTMIYAILIGWMDAESNQIADKFNINQDFMEIIRKGNILVNKIKATKDFVPEENKLSYR